MENGRPGMTGSLRELMRDAITLGELQLRLLLLDLREGSRRMLMPLAAIGIALCLALGCFPVMLAALGYGLHTLGIPQWGAFLIAAAVGLVVSGLTAYGGWRWLSKELMVLDRSASELRNNVEWVKSALHDH